MIPLACGSITCAPSPKYTLKPLSYGGLWLAVITAPALACRWRTANESSGTDRGLSNTNASQPFSAATFAADCANSLEKNRGSCATTIFGLAEICSRLFQSCRYATSPRVARLILKKFIAFVPTHGNCGRSSLRALPRSAAVTIFPIVRPRSPPVPNASVW